MILDLHHVAGGLIAVAIPHPWMKARSSKQFWVPDSLDEEKEY